MKANRQDRPGTFGRIFFFFFGRNSFFVNFGTLGYISTEIGLAVKLGYNRVYTKRGVSYAMLVERMEVGIDQDSQGEIDVKGSGHREKAGKRW